MGIIGGAAALGIIHGWRITVISGRPIFSWTKPAARIEGFVIKTESSDADSSVSSRYCGSIMSRLQLAVWRAVLIGCQKSGVPRSVRIFSAETSSRNSSQCDATKSAYCPAATTVTRWPRARNATPSPMNGRTSPSVPSETRIACIPCSTVRLRICFGEHFQNCHASSGCYARRGK